MTSKFSADDIKSFYFSKASKYQNFLSKNSPSASHNITTPVGVSTVDNLSISDVNISPISVMSPYRRVPTPATTPVTNTVFQPRLQADDVAAAGSGLAVARKNGLNYSSTTVGAGDNVSSNYITFLRQQQDLMKVHHSIDDIIGEVLEFSKQHQRNHHQQLTESLVLLHSAEKGTDWNWTSKFNIDALYKDAELEVSMSDLFTTETSTVNDSLTSQQQILVSLRQEYCCGENYKSNKYPFGTELKSTLENGISCFAKLIKQFSSSQLDANPVVRMSDDLLDQLCHVLSNKHISSLLQEINDTIEVLIKKEKDCRAVRNQALEDGIMDVAERETYNLASIGEEIISAHVNKIEILSNLSLETAGHIIEGNDSLNKSQEAAKMLEKDSDHLKFRCENDITRLKTLKKRLDSLEKTMSERTEKERRESDTCLSDIWDRQSRAWDQIASLLGQICDMEKERHKEVKKRMEIKIKEEARRNEYAAFNKITEEQLRNYDRTIKNSNINMHCASHMGEYLRSGFNAIAKGLEERKKSIDEFLLEAQKDHLEGYRSLMFTLGDLEYRKERKTEELAERVQEAYIQQEMCADSLNPSAKKFSETKKDLLIQRDEVLLELRDIKVRQETSTVQFEPSRKALNIANVPYSDPVDELDDMRLEQRAKIVEYKAMALRRDNSIPVRKELISLKHQLTESKKVIISKGGTLNASPHTPSSLMKRIEYK